MIRKKIIILLLPVFFLSISISAMAFTKGNNAEQAQLSTREPDLMNSLALIKNGNLKEVKEILARISTIDSYAEKDKKAIFEAFYEGFVKSSKEFRLTDAVLLGETWTRLFPAEKMPALYYATVLSENNNSQEANVIFSEGFKREDKYRKVDERLLNYFYYNAAGSLADTEEWQKSMDYVLKIEKRDKNFAGLNNIKCRIYYYLNKFDEGLKSCEEAIKTDEKRVSALEYVTYSGYYRRNKNYPRSLEIITKAMSRYPLADGLAMTAAADHIRLGDYYQALMLCIREDMIAQMYFYDNKNIRELKQTIQNEIAGKKTDEALKAAKVFAFLKMLNDKKYEEAIKTMDQLSENTLIYREGIEIFRGEALEALGKNEEAEKVYKYVLSRDPTLIIGYCKLFELYEKKMNQHEKALEMFTQAKKIKPDHWKVQQIEVWLQTKR